MSKSLNNYIGITEPPAEIFGKTMSISDTLMLRYYELLTDVPLPEVKLMHPKEAKARLGKIFVARFYNEAEAMAAEAGFESVFSKGNLPEEVKLVTVKEKKLPIVKLVAEAGLAPSASEAKRLVKQGGVRVDDKVINDEKEIIDLKTERVLNVGKRKFVRVICE